LTAGFSGSVPAREKPVDRKNRQQKKSVVK
jgi:hypothetical protein